MSIYQISAIDGTALSGISCTGYLYGQDGTDDAAAEPAFQERSDALPVYVVQSVTPRQATAIVEFKSSSYAPKRDALRLLDLPNTKGLRTFTVEAGDANATTSCTIQAAIRSHRIDPSAIHLTLVVPDWTFQAVAATTDGPTNFSAAGSRTLTVGGETTTYPLLKIGWSVQRAASNATVGWTYRRRITVTNNSTQALWNHPLQLGPINTAALVAGSKMQSSAADLVVFDDKGKRLRHGIAGNTNGTNNRATFLWFVVDELAAGASRTYDVCYGNPSAAYDATNNAFPYTYPGSPAIDTTGIDGQASGTPTATTLPLAAGTTLDPNRFVGSTVILTGATSAIGGQYRRVASHTTSATATLTVSRAFTTTPDTTTGYVVVGGGFMGDGGGVSSATSTTLTDTNQVWNTNEWIGATVEIVTLDTTMGTVTNTSTGTVTANTATQLTVAGWGSGTPTAGQRYRVWKKNGNWVWRVSQDRRTQTSHRGRWRLNAGLTRPAQMWFRADGSPASWSLTTYNPDDASNDYNQLRSTGTNTGSSVDWFAVLNASIARKDGARLRGEGYANGCEIYCPFGILGTLHDYQLKNPAGAARAVFGCRERGGEDWSLYLEDSATHAALTNPGVAYYDLTALGTPLHLLAALTSADDADIAKTVTSTANLQDGTVLEVRVDTRNLSVTDFASATEDSVYDLSLTVRRGGASEAAGDDLVLVGGDDRHLFLKSSEKVWVGPDGIVPLATRVYDGSTYVRDVPNSVQLFHDASDATGTRQRYVSSSVLPLPPGSPVLRVSDDVGSVGTVDVTLVWNERYL